MRVLNIRKDAAKLLGWRLKSRTFFCSSASQWRFLCFHSCRSFRTLQGNLKNLELVLGKLKYTNHGRQVGADIGHIARTTIWAYQIPLPYGIIQNEQTMGPESVGLQGSLKLAKATSCMKLWSLHIKFFHHRFT